jgi:hypothetical protein
MIEGAGWNREIPHLDGKIDLLQTLYLAVRRACLPSAAAQVPLGGGASADLDAGVLRREAPGPTVGGLRGQHGGWWLLRKTREEELVEACGGR